MFGSPRVSTRNKVDVRSSDRRVLPPAPFKPVPSLGIRREPLGPRNSNAAVLEAQYPRSLVTPIHSSVKLGETWDGRRMPGFAVGDSPRTVKETDSDTSVLREANFASNSSNLAKSAINSPKFSNLEKNSLDFVKNSTKFGNSAKSPNLAETRPSGSLRSSPYIPIKLSPRLETHSSEFALSHLSSDFVLSRSSRSSSMHEQLSRLEAGLRDVHVRLAEQQVNFDSQRAQWDIESAALRAECDAQRNRADRLQKLVDVQAAIASTHTSPGKTPQTVAQSPPVKIAHTSTPPLKIKNTSSAQSPAMKIADTYMAQSPTVKIVHSSSAQSPPVKIANTSRAISQSGENSRAVKPDLVGNSTLADWARELLDSIESVSLESEFDKLDPTGSGSISRDLCLELIRNVVALPCAIPKVICSRMLRTVSHGTVLLHRATLGKFFRLVLEFIIEQEKARQ